MDSVAAQPLHAEEKSDGGFKLCSQEQHLEVEEGLLVHREVGLACRRGGKTYSGGSCRSRMTLGSCGPCWAERKHEPKIPERALGTVNSMR